MFFVSAIDFINGLLQVKMNKRLTVQKALSHVWLQVRLRRLSCYVSLLARVHLFRVTKLGAIFAVWKRKSESDTSRTNRTTIDGRNTKSKTTLLRLNIDGSPMSNTLSLSFWFLRPPFDESVNYLGTVCLGLAVFIS